LQDDLRDIFRRLQKTVVIVTHDIGEAGYFADKLAMIHGGRVLQEGPLREFVRQPADETVTQFIRSQRRPLEGLD
ncbi:MAG: ABC transporter ATP-binding protein, partial [Planctomycetota bacterium]